MGAIGTVLLVDDDDLVRESMGDILDYLGFEVHAARTAENARAMLPTLTRLDLLMTDIVMPDVDGWTLAEIVREVYPEVTVVCVTGHYELEVKRPLPRSLIAYKPMGVDDVERVLAAVGITVPRLA